MADEWWGAHLLERGKDGDTWAISGAEVTWSELRSGVGELRHTFDAHGIREGSTVILRMSPGFTYLYALLALWSHGACVILVDSRMQPAEYEPLVEMLAPQYIVTSAEPGGPVAGFRAGDHPKVERRPSGRDADPAFCLVQFSSGSTGQPKVIGRSPESILVELARHAALDGMLVDSDRLVILNSVTHTMGLVTGILHAMDNGAVIVLPPTGRPMDVLRLMAGTRATAVFGVPARFQLLNQAMSSAGLDPPTVPSLRLAVSGGERLPQQTYDDFQLHFGLSIGQVYGVTETGLLAGDPTGTWPPPAVGKPVAEVEERLVDQELYVRLEHSPYLHNDVPDRFVDGWLRTYDRFERNPRTGVLTPLGRADSLAIIGGMKIDLTEVEIALLHHPGVREAVVTHAEVIEAFVAAEAGLDANELTAWCRDRLNPLKIPKRFLITAELPRNSTGKLLRNRDLIHSRLTGTPA